MIQPFSGAATRRLRCAATWTLVAASAGCSTPTPETKSLRTADHHLHIRSRAAAAHQARLGELLGQPSTDTADARKSVTTADVIEALDHAGIHRGIVVSNAYMFGMPDLETENERETVEAENRYVAEQVALYADRLVGFCSVNPLKAYALDEIARCANELQMGGLKLHLANSDVDLGDPVQIEVLARIFAQADRFALPLLVHLRTRSPDYGAEDASTFIEHVLPHARTVPVQIAHMAGWGGYDDQTDAALGSFASAFEDGLLSEKVEFGLGAVVFLPEAAGADTALARTVGDANSQLADRIRQVGVDRVVYATDWPSWPPNVPPSEGISANVELVKSALPLNEGELSQLFANVSGAFAGLPD